LDRAIISFTPSDVGQFGSVTCFVVVPGHRETCRGRHVASLAVAQPHTLVGGYSHLRVGEVRSRGSSFDHFRFSPLIYKIGFFLPLTFKTVYFYVLDDFDSSFSDVVPHHLKEVNRITLLLPPSQIV